MLVPTIKELRVSVIKGAEYNPEDRVKGVGIHELADSMSRIGLIYEIVVDEKNVLIDGHRRVAAAKLLEWPTIMAKVMPSEQRDAIYGQVNFTAKKMVGRDSLGVWLQNKEAVSPKQASEFAKMEAHIGRKLVSRIFKEGLSARVWKTAIAIGKYIQLEDITKIVEWLLDHAVIGQVMKALEAKEDPRVFALAIQKNKPIRFRLQVD